MPILHNESKERYTCIDNDVLQSGELSLKAKGMLVILLSLPQDWEFSQQGMRGFFSDGTTAMRTALDELEEKGYLQRGRERGEDGKLGDSVWVVSEKPILENLILEKLILEKRLLQSNNIQSTNLQSTKEISSGSAEPAPQADEIVAYLNGKLGTRYRATTRSTSKHINARLREGYTVADFKAVIDKKVAKWKDDPKMSAYLRPETLFGAKFESYLNELDAGGEGVSSADFSDYLR